MRILRMDMNTDCKAYEIYLYCQEYIEPQKGFSGHL